MKKLYLLTVIFFLGSAVGWVLELFYRRYAHKKWINPGFLVGPWLPIYGLGVLIMYGVCSIPFDLGNEVLSKIALCGILAVLIVLLEYLTGLFFIKGLKVKLWDYSDRKGNIQGIICPQFALIWASIGVVYCFLIHTPLTKVVEFMENHQEFTYIVGVFMGEFIADVCYSFNIIKKLRKWAKTNNAIVIYEKLKIAISTKAKELHDKANFIFSFRSKDGLEKELENYRIREEQAKKTKRK